jgi:hypothetical protein
MREKGGEGGWGKEGVDKSNRDIGATTIWFYLQLYLNMFQLMPIS